MTQQDNAAAAEESVTKPGWLYDAHSGICAGPASYEQQAQWNASGGLPIRTTYAGCPCAYVIRPHGWTPFTEAREATK